MYVVFVDDVIVAVVRFTVLILTIFFRPERDLTQQKLKLQA